MYPKLHIARRFTPRLVGFEPRLAPSSVPHNLLVANFYQSWSTPSLITVNDDWSGTPSVTGYLGDDTFGEGVDPQTIVAPNATIDVVANQGSNTVLTVGGAAEFDGLTNRVVALQADATADAPHLVVSVNTTGRANVSISYTLRDVDGTADDAVQPVALQYRIGNSGSFINVPAGYVADATTGPSAAFKESQVSVTLPGAVANQPEVQFRIITSNAVGNDEWVGVDDIQVASREFDINTYTTSNQFNPSVAMDADGDTLVVWESFGQAGPGFGTDIYGQRFNAAGSKVGGEFLVNTSTSNTQQTVSVAMDADGDAIVVWNSYQQDGSLDGIVGQRFNAAGAKVGGEIQVNTYTTGRQQFPAVAVDADGDTVVVWQSNLQDGSSYGVYGQRFDAAGMKVGGEFQVNTTTNNAQRFPSVAMDADGDIFVAWESLQTSDLNVYGQRFDAAGMKVGGEFLINTFTGSHEYGPSVSMDAVGNAFVAWVDVLQDASTNGIYAQRFDAAGMKVGAEFRVNTNSEGHQIFPSVAMDADGDAFVTWQGELGQSGIYGQRFSPSGTKVGTEFRISTFAVINNRYKSVALDTDGDAFTVWSSFSVEGIGLGSEIYGQRFQSANVPQPAMVSNIQVNGGATQRSMVTSLKIAFNSNVSFSGSPAAAFTLVNQKTSNATTLSAVVDGTGTAVTLSFTGGSIDLGGSLADGRYTLTILANQFTGMGFDGNGDSTAGDDYVLIGTPANGLFRLFGDNDGDGGVSASDFIQFRLALGGSSVSFDFDNDGSVAAIDFIQFRLRFGGSI